MSTSDSASDSTAPGPESVNVTRPTSALSVLLASAGTPPFDPGQARLAPIRLYDAFVLDPERAPLFYGDPRALFADHAEAIDPRHDALARLVRHVATLLRARIEVYESGPAGRDLVRGVPALAAAQIEGALAGYSLQRTTATQFTSDLVLGRRAPKLDPLEHDDAGVLRRFLALATCGLVLERPPRAGGVVADLGAVALALALFDLAANPRSALRAVRARLTKLQRIDADGTARARDVGQALRELIAHAVGSASNAGAAGRELVREPWLPNELLAHFGIALARAVYDGLGPDTERPFVVAGAGAADALTFAPLFAGRDDDGEPMLGLYNRVAFITLPYARTDDRAALDLARPSIPSAGAVHEAALDAVRDALRSSTIVPPAGSTLVATVDPTDPSHGWLRTAVHDTPARVLEPLAWQPVTTRIVLLVGPRGPVARATLDALAASLAREGGWQLLVPRAADRTLAFESLGDEKRAAVALRRADVSRWLDADGVRAVHWDVEPGSPVLVYAATVGDDVEGVAIESLLAIVRDLGDKAVPRTVMVLAGATHYAGVARCLSAIAHHPELESGDVPLRGGSITLVRTDGPIVREEPTSRGVDLATLTAIAQPWSGTGPIGELAARAALTPSAPKYRGRLVRLAALATITTAFGEVRGALERAVLEPENGRAMRRALQAGVGTLVTSRAALGAGLATELAGCMRHELSVLVAEWDGAGKRIPAARIADLARGWLVELVLTALPKATVLASDGVRLAGGTAITAYTTPVESVAGFARRAIGVRPTGTIHRRDDVRESIALGFAVEDARARLVVLVEPVASALTSRRLAGPVAELRWTRPASRENTLGLVAWMVAAVHEAALRWTDETPVSGEMIDGKRTHVVLADVEVGPALDAVAVRWIVPLVSGATEAEAMRVAGDLAVRLDDLPGAWAARALLDDFTTLELPLRAVHFSRVMTARAARALRELPGYFPGSRGPSERYATDAWTRSAVALGVAGAVLDEYGMDPASPEGRQVLARLSFDAVDLATAAGRLASMLPLLPDWRDGTAWEQVERVLTLAWFLHANFCVAAPGPIAWACEGGPDARPLVDRYVDHTALRDWLERKTRRPPTVEARVNTLLAAIEPRVVVAG